MKTKLSLILLILCFSIGGFVFYYFYNNHVLKSEIVQIEISETLTREGILYQKNSKNPFTGKVLVKNKESIIWEINSYKNGKLDGISETFRKSDYSSDWLISQDHYKKGKRTKSIVFKNSGSIDHIFEYEDDVQINSTVFDIDGSIESVSEFNSDGSFKIHYYGKDNSIKYTNHFDENGNKTTTYP